jgi:hypothetical protein
MIAFPGVQWKAGPRRVRALLRNPPACRAARSAVRDTGIKSLVQIETRFE